MVNIAEQLQRYFVESDTMAQTHTNRLIAETSPYLLQHAHNPVDWYPWGEEALQKAKTEDKPILVSIGYAACHWCHVMERESFENEETAALMNAYFVNIKIDREERPDLDHIYMDAVQAMTGSGGWPLNVFLLPDGRPFYGGTYFPPVPAFNRGSWQDVLNGVHEAYTKRKHEMEAQAENLTQHLVNANSFGISTTTAATVFTKENCDLIAANILKQADTTWGGFGKAPKFPQVFSIQYLLRHYHFTQDTAALQQALLSLDKMIDGGIYDQIGGGFARYSTDVEWLAPHFEKMLYDNALLIGVLSEAYLLTREERYAAVIRQTIGFVERELLHPDGGFYSALDADSEGVEGKYYTWRYNEVVAVLGADAVLFCAYYDITSKGNWEHTNILRVTKPFKAFAAEHHIDEATLAMLLQDGREKLLAVRAGRIRPLLDDKILLNWNALMITALCKAYAALLEPQYLQLAEKGIGFLEQHCVAEGNWKHSYKNGVAKIPAFLDDYAYLIQAYIVLQEITGEINYLQHAKKLTVFVIDSFGEENGWYCYYTQHGQQDIVVRKKEVYDGATPSGNAVMAENLLYLGVVYDQPDWRKRAEQMVESLGTAIVRYPTSFGVWASVIQQQVAGVNEIVAAGKAVSQSMPKILNNYIPNKILLSTSVDNEEIVLLRGKYPENGVMFYLCRNYICEADMKTPEAILEKIISNRR